ncbi:MAG: ribosome small subunit-dependent GTPase A [Balneolales bacterium]
MLMQGLITKATGSWYQARLDNGHMMECRLPGKFRLSDEQVTNPVTVGDRVHIVLQNDGTGMIEHIEERRNKLLRQATHGRKGTQMLAANVDYVLIIQSLKQPVFKTGFIDRLLVCCEAYDINPVIVMNKTDLSENKKDAARLSEVLNLYTGLGYSFVTTSIYDPDSIHRLKELIEGSISVMTGPSGTGKTSLLNSMATDQDLKTAEISHFSNKGKHTTTFSHLIPVSENTRVIDTPGVREFGLVDLKSYEISLYFPEMASIRESCHYYNCTHGHEPNCAVIEAVENGRIAASRYRSYRHIVESNGQDQHNL